MAVIFKPTDSIFIDTNIFIYSLEETGILGNKSRSIIEQIKLKKPKTYTTTLTISEILTGVFEKGMENKVTRYLEFISGNGLINVLDLDVQIAILTAQLRARFKIKTPDAIQLGSALFAECSLFISADRKLPKKIDNLKIIQL